MSASHRGSPIATIVTLLIAALILYVATWPPIEIKCRTGSGAGGHYLAHSPEWVEAFYRPLHALCDLRSGRHPVGDYWVWWMDLLDAKYPME